MVKGGKKFSPFLYIYTMAKKIKYLMIHCTATEEGKDYTGQDIERWHTSPKSKGGRGWRQVGYSDLIWRDGNNENLVPYNKDQIVDVREITNGAKDYNGIARHICYVGGLDKNGKPKDTRTPEQLETLKQHVEAAILWHPDIKIIGHNQVSSKDCPSFNVPEWLESIGIPSKYIIHGKIKSPISRQGF